MLAVCKKLEPAATGWKGEAFRFSGLKYAKAHDQLTGFGSRDTGARFNANGTFPAVYTSLDPVTAVIESMEYYRHYLLPLVAAMPRVFVGITFDLQCVLDLRAPGIRRRLRLKLGDLREEWRPFQQEAKESGTQALGRAAHDAGFEAVLVPSARNPKGMNFIYFPESLRPGSHAAVLHEDNLAEFLK